MKSPLFDSFLEKWRRPLFGVSSVLKNSLLLFEFYSVTSFKAEVARHPDGHILPTKGDAKAVVVKFINERHQEANSN